MYSTLCLFLKNLKIRIYELQFFKLQYLNIFVWILINLINDDAFILAATVNTCLVVHLVCLFMKTHLLALLQDNCLDLVCCAFLHMLSGCVRNITALSTPTLPIYLWNLNISPIYRPGRYISLSLLTMTVLTLVDVFTH